jgi:heme-degrading monooxygenase HmoA
MCIEFALYSVHPGKKERFISSLPELRSLIRALPGQRGITTSTVSDIPETFLDIALWESATAMQQGGDSLMASEPGQRLFSALEKVHFMHATTCIWNHGEWNAHAPHTLIVYQVTSERGLFNAKRDALYAALTAVNGVAIRQFEAIELPGFIIDIYQAAVVSEAVEAINVVYHSPLMKEFEACIAAPELMSAMGSSPVPGETFFQEIEAYLTLKNNA